ncbi:MAG TPA: SapC family protein, partial [Sphingomonas sp.]
MTHHAILTAEAHRSLRIRTDFGVELGDGKMCSLVVPAEFRDVQNEYAILFRHNPERDGFTAVAMFGFEADENLFLEDGRWDARHRPLAMAIQPFLIGGADDAGAKQVHLDMNSPRVVANGGEGVRVFDDDGRPTPYLEQIAERLGALDEGYRRSSDFFAALRRYELLEPLTLDITLNDGSTNRLVGF